MNKTIEALIANHTAFWNRELKKPVVNMDCGTSSRFGFVPALPQTNGKIERYRKGSPLTLGVGVTRAERRTMILTPKGKPCSLLV